MAENDGRTLSPTGLEATKVAISDEKQRFPCPACTEAREVRMTKQNKPYLHCDPCGIQLFVRGPSGIATFNRLVERSNAEDLWTRLKEMQRPYCLRCPECGHHFWIEPDLAETSAWDGSLKGFRCPGKNCDAIIAWEKNP